MAGWAAAATGTATMLTAMESKASEVTAAAELASAAMAVDGAAAVTAKAAAKMVQTIVSSTTAARTVAVVTVKEADMARTEPTSTAEPAVETTTMMVAVEPAVTAVVDVQSKQVASETTIVARAAP